MTTYSVQEFIELTKSEPHNWINYCEIMILQNGRIILSRPSHSECVLAYVMEREGKKRDQIWEELREDLLDPLHFYVDKYMMIAVWYEYLIKSSLPMNKFQTQTLNILKDTGLLSKNPQIIETEEYQKFILRQELKKGM